MCDTGISLTDFEQEESQINYLLSEPSEETRRTKYSQVLVAKYHLCCNR